MLLVTQKLWPVIKDSNFTYPAWISILDNHRISMRYPYWISIGYPWDTHTWISMGYPYLDIRGTFGYFKYPARLTSIQISSSPLKPGIIDHRSVDPKFIIQIIRVSGLLDSNVKFAAQTSSVIIEQIHRSKINISKFIILFPAILDYVYGSVSVKLPAQTSSVIIDHRSIDPI